MTDWFRKKSWTENDEEEFFKKLNRARKGGRAQYLRIQAIELIVTKDKSLLEVAENLLNKILIEFPKNESERGLTLCHLGEIYKQREDIEKSIQYYKQAIDFEEEFPGVQTEAYLIFSELIVKMNKLEYFTLVESIILKRFPNMLFPIEKYKAYSILAIVSYHKKDFEKAEYYSSLAEQSASLDTSGLRYHKNLGVVNERDFFLDDLVKQK